MSSVIQILAEEKCPFLSLGVVAGPELGEIRGLSRLSNGFVQGIYWLVQKFFHLDSKKIYLNKFQPDSRKTHLLFSDSLGFKDLMALKKVLNVKL